MDQRDWTSEDKHDYLMWQRRKSRGKLFVGALIVLFGVLYLLKEIGLAIPRELFFPSTFLIVIGLVILVKSKFRKFMGYFLVGLGVTFKLHNYYPEMINLRLVWPIIIIMVGVAILLKARKTEHLKNCKDFRRHSRSGLVDDTEVSPEDFVDGTSIFGGVKRIVTSKNFRGADLLTIFGGTELDLSQADFEGEVIVDLTTVFGGTELLIPTTWQVRTEMVTIFGGIDDNRYTKPSDSPSARVLILRGTCVLGGVEIKSAVG